MRARPLARLGLESNWGWAHIGEGVLRLLNQVGGLLPRLLLVPLLQRGRIVRRGQRPGNGVVRNGWRHCLAGCQGVEVVMEALALKGARRIKALCLLLQPFAPFKEGAPLFLRH